jgi:Zn-dependent metalloprotease
MNQIAIKHDKREFIWLIPLIFLFCSITSVALAGSHPPPFVTDAQRRILLKLTVDAPDGQSARVIFNKKNGTPALIKVKPFTPAPRTAQRQEFALGRTENAARQFLFENRALLKIEDPDQELDLIKSWPDRQGAAHFKYQQMVGDVPVFGKQMIVHVDGNNSVYLLNGQYEPTPPALSTTPTITENDAIEAVRRHLGVSDLSPTQIELTVFTKPNREMVLTYKVEVAPSLSEAWTYFIDAGNASFVHRITRIYNETASAGGTDLNDENQTFNAWHHQDNKYYLIDPGMPGPAENVDDSRDYVGDPNNVNNLQYPGNTYILSANHTEGEELVQIGAASPLGPWDPAGVSAMANTRRVYQYYHDTFNRNGIDNNYMNYNVIVNAGPDYADAFFRPGAIISNDSYMVFGDGVDQIASNMAASLDVTAHEFQHGVTEYTAGLIYENQSGALNEAYSDLFACMVDNDDWTIGEDVILIDPGYLRNLSDPTKGIEPLPTKMSEYQDLPNTYEGDWGGVHTNMSIPGHAGYLMAEGLDNSLGRDRTARIWYRALTAYLTSDSEFGDARIATVQSAEDLYGPNSTEVAVVRAAWDEVEVSDNTTTPAATTEIIVSPKSLNFKEVPVGKQVTQTITLKNHGDREIYIYDIWLDNSSCFIQSKATIYQRGGEKLPKNGAMNIDVTYVPQKAGSESAALTITSDAAIPTDDVSITGNAVKNDGDGGSSGGCMISTIGHQASIGKIALSFLMFGIVLIVVYARTGKRKGVAS